MGRSTAKIICLAFATALFSGLSEGVYDDNIFTSEEDDGVQVLNQIQSDYRSAFEKVVQFVNVFDSSMASVNKRIETLEKAKNVKELEARILAQSIQIQQAFNVIDNLRMEIESLKVERQATPKPPTPTALIETTVMPAILTTPESTTPVYKSAEDYLKYLRTHRSPAKGRSFNGSTLEEISAAVPRPKALTIEIVNYRGLNLHGYKLHLTWGVAFNSAPDDVPPNTREVFTFQRTGPYMPMGVSVYRIGGTDFSVHLYFYSYCLSHICSREFAVAVLPNQDSEVTIYRPYSYSSRHKGPVGSFAQISQATVDVHDVTATTVHRNNIYAKATFKAEEDRGLIILEVFDFPF